MATYTLPSRELPLDDSWDVVVVGGGPAGCTAATAAAREGARTLLVEATGCLGGMGTSGMVPAWCPFSDKEKLVYRGLAEKVFMAARQGMAHVKSEQLDWVPIDAELLKRVYDDLVTDAGAQVLFHTFLSAVEGDGQGGVKALIVSNKSGLSALKAKVYVDCTGDADLAAWAGAAFLKGDPDTGELQPATHCFTLSNVDTYAYTYGPVLHAQNRASPIYRIVDSGKYPLIPDTHICNCLVGPGLVGFNAGHVWDADNTNPQSISRALMRGRKLAEEYRKALAEFYPRAFGNAFLSATGSLLGVRETRRIVGDYCLTVEDYMQRMDFADGICRNSYYLDLHPSLEIMANIRAGKVDVERRSARYGKGESHAIPYRCLTPKGLRDVLVAGRCISCERAVQGSVRVMPVCLAMGEAAGMAAAMAAAAPRLDVHAVDVARLRARLFEQGAYL